MSDQISVTITRQDKYRFLVDYGSGLPASVADEPAPLGDGDETVAVALLRPASPTALPPASSLRTENSGRPWPSGGDRCLPDRSPWRDRNRLRVVGIGDQSDAWRCARRLPISTAPSPNLPTSAPSPRAWGFIHNGYRHRARWPRSEARVSTSLSCSEGRTSTPSALQEPS